MYIQVFRKNAKTFTCKIIRHYQGNIALRQNKGYLSYPAVETEDQTLLIHQETEQMQI